MKVPANILLVLPIIAVTSRQDSYKLQDQNKVTLRFSFTVYLKLS